MKKIIFLYICAVLLAACAGNPPAWWNPGNTYSSTSRQSVSDEKPRTHFAAPSPVPAMPAEESIALPDESYEEMMLTPLQDEDPETSGAAQTAPASETAYSSLAESGVLPPPSVLE